MKVIGMIRNIDDLGRLVIPKEYRDCLELMPHTPVEIVLTNNRLVIRKAVTGCALCGNTENVLDFEDSLVCLFCLQKMKEL